MSRDATLSRSGRCACLCTDPACSQLQPQSRGTLPNCPTFPSVGARPNLAPWWGKQVRPWIFPMQIILAPSLPFPFLSSTRPIDSAVHRTHNRYRHSVESPTRVVVDEVCDFEARRGIPPRRHKSRPSIVALRVAFTCCLGSVRGAVQIC